MLVIGEKSLDFFLSSKLDRNKERKKWSVLHFELSLIFLEATFAIWPLFSLARDVCRLSIKEIRAGSRLQYYYLYHSPSKFPPSKW